MANSGTVTAGSAALASQYNNLRDDVLNISTGHTHTGASENGAKVAATGVSSGTAANGAVLTANGSGAAAFLAAGASGGILKYEEFTSSGSFVIPASASSSAVIILEIVGAGNGGGGGACRGAGTAGPGGDGGGGGGYLTHADLMTSYGTAGGTVTVTIGAGGAGGTAQSTAGAATSGSIGGDTSFGTLTMRRTSNLHYVGNAPTDVWFKGLSWARNTLGSAGTATVDPYKIGDPTTGANLFAVNIGGQAGLGVMLISESPDTMPI